MRPLSWIFRKNHAINMAGEKVSPLPIIIQAQAVEAIVSKLARNLVKVVVFLLT